MTVMRSIETQDGVRCVDVFVRTDGSWGFDEYRRDPEDPRGWSVCGHQGQRRFNAEAGALDAAVQSIPWLKEVLERDGTKTSGGR